MSRNEGEREKTMSSDGGRAVSPASLSIEALEEIVRNCQRNEQRLHELERHTRHERKKAERILRQTSRSHRERRSSEMSKDFFVPLDQNDDENLLERVEKLLAGPDGTTTSSELMSSREPVIQTNHSSRSTTNDRKTRDLPSACSIEFELSTVDRLLSERTPTHDRKFSKEKFDQRDEKFYDRLNNYVHTGRFTTENDEKPLERISPQKSRKNDEDLKDLARRCEDLLARLHAQRQRAEILESVTHVNDFPQRSNPTPSPRSIPPHEDEHDSIYDLPPPPSMSLQQSLELLRPDFISRSRQRARRIRLLREEREHNAEIDQERQRMLLFSTAAIRPVSVSRASSANSVHRNVAYFIPSERRPSSSRLPVSYHEMKQATKKRYQQLPEVNDRRRQAQLEESRRRNLLRAKVFRSRLRQHVLRHGRTNIDESLTIVDS